MKIVQYLVENGLDVNAKNGHGDLPIHYAAKHGYLDVVKYLVESGALQKIGDDFWDVKMEQKRIAFLNKNWHENGCKKTRRNFQFVHLFYDDFCLLSTFSCFLLHINLSTKLVNRLSNFFHFLNFECKSWHAPKKYINKNKNGVHHKMK